MSGSSLKFGTSGLRGLVGELAGAETRRYVGAFLRQLEASGKAGTRKVYIGRDLRASSAGILGDCAAAIRAFGWVPVDCGALPTPALALHAMAGGGAAIVVTGSHIPADRNGLKFYRPDGEIDKADEAGIVVGLGDAEAREGTLADESAVARERYVSRYAGMLWATALAGWRIGVFVHSSVAASVLAEVLVGYGARIVMLGASEAFVAVDTEAFGDAVFAPLAGWVEAHRLDAVVSADGDGDRPLLMDGRGAFVRGDALGVLAARLVGADTVVTPVTSNSGIENLGFRRVLRTRVGSPHVIAGMETISERCIVGFEANGGTLLGSEVEIGAARLTALPTRDAVLPIVAALGLAAERGISVAEMVKSLGLRAAVSDRLSDVPAEASARLLDRLGRTGFADGYFEPLGPIAGRSDLDGLQFDFAGGERVHYRASGNAPELRCYVEAPTLERARDLLAWGMAAASSALG